MRNVLRREQRRPRSKEATDSNRFPGHEGRMAAHMMRIRNHPCQCGSGKRYADCCISRPNQERLELANRKNRGLLL